MLIIDIPLLLYEDEIDRLVQDCSISSALAMEILQSCTKPLRYEFHWLTDWVWCHFRKAIHDNPPPPPPPPPNWLDNSHWRKTLNQFTMNLKSINLVMTVFSCNQAALWMVQSVRPFVTRFWLCSHHRIIMKFSGVITNDRSDVHAKGQGQRSNFNVTQLKKSSILTQIGCFRTATLVWIHSPMAMKWCTKLEAT